MPNNIKLVIFDLDKTLINETLCDETEKVLQQLKEKKYMMAIASYNKYAKWFCDRYDISKFFDVICAKRDLNKASHIQSIINFYFTCGIKIQPYEIMFFDDKHSNCNFIQQFGIISHLVDKKHGIRLSDIKLLI